MEIKSKSQMRRIRAQRGEEMDYLEECRKDEKEELTIMESTPIEIYDKLREENDTLKKRIAELDLERSRLRVESDTRADAVTVMEQRAEQAESRLARLREAVERHRKECDDGGYILEHDRKLYDVLDEVSHV